MELAAIIVLGVSILGLIALFFIKHWEEKNARIFMPKFRLAADDRSLEIKSILLWCQKELQKLGPTSLRITRFLLHDLALSLAALSRASERGAHKLADMVSHKHAFQRRETKSEFLKQVSETPIRNLRDMAQPVTQSNVETEESSPIPLVTESLTVTTKKQRNGKKGKNAPQNPLETQP